MLRHLQDVGYRAGEFSIEPIPAAEIARVLSTLEQYYGSEHQPAVLVPHRDEAAIRDVVQRAAPRLATLARQIVAALENDYSAVYIRRAYLDQLDLATREFVLFAITLCMGRPTATDRIDRRIVWDIKTRGDRMKAGHVPTFSEHSNEADLHTDTQYYPDPERYVLLYVVAPASCGGGVSSLRHMRCIKAQMSRTDAGVRAGEYLARQELPFRIPTSFTSTGAPDLVEVTLARIFGDHPGIRFRGDTLERGLEAFPGYDTPELRRALAILTAELADMKWRLAKYLEADSIQVINNHEVLHGRTAFSDPRRHLLRIRIAAPGAA